MKDKKIKERDLYIIILAMVVMLGFGYVKINSLSGSRSRPWTQKVELFSPCITYTERISS